MAIIYKTDGSIFAQDDSCATKEDLVKRLYRDGVRNFSRVDFTHINLSKMKFSFCIFSSAHFMYTNLSEAIFLYSRFHYSTFHKNNLYHTEFEFCDFSDSIFSDVILYDTNFNCTNFHKSQLKEIKLINGVVKKIKYLDIHYDVSASIVYENGDEYIKLGCYERKLEEWEMCFRDKKSPFCKKHYTELNIIKIAFEIHKKILEMWRKESV